MTLMENSKNFAARASISHVFLCPLNPSSFQPSLGIKRILQGVLTRSSASAKQKVSPRKVKGNKTNIFQLAFFFLRIQF